VEKDNFCFDSQPASPTFHFLQTLVLFFSTSLHACLTGAWSLLRIFIGFVIISAAPIRAHPNRKSEPTLRVARRAGSGRHRRGFGQNLEPTAPEPSTRAIGRFSLLHTLLRRLLYLAFTTLPRAAPAPSLSPPNFSPLIRVTTSLSLSLSLSLLPAQVE
jgi:hypothetical protein